MTTSMRLRRLGYVAGAGLAVYTVDNYGFSSALERSIRTLFYGAVIAADYKFNFEKTDLDACDRVHERSAARMAHVCRTNGGLYIKFAQQIASVPVLPTPFRFHFKDFYDNAPAVDYSEVQSVFKEEFGKDMTEMFQTFQKEPIASASIAQVHQATLKDGTSVAVKVQKPAIQKQIDADLLNYRIVLYLYEKFFDLPLYWSFETINTHLRQETDFVREGKNAEKCYASIQEIPSLKNLIYVPKVYWDYSSKRILTCEWINGIRFSDIDAVKSSGLPTTSIMESIVDVFSDQIFRVGFVHADPHPGNIIIRSHPQQKAPYQVVLLDHGLYIQSSEEFRRKYSLFWKSLFTLDFDTMESIARSWGIKDVQLFASSTLQRPWKRDRAIHTGKLTMKDIQESRDYKDRFKDFLSDSELIPRELVFIGRNLNIVRSNNRVLGSPVNRINRMANSAVKSLGADVWSISSASSSLSTSTWISQIRSQYAYLTFQCTLLLATITFNTTRWLQYISYHVFGKVSKGFEDLMDDRIKERLQRELPGLKIDETLFDG